MKTRTKTTMLVAGTLLVLAITPVASAGDAVLYTCDLDTGNSGQYNCSGVGTNDAGELCEVIWTDDDADDNWEDDGATIQHTQCGGKMSDIFGGGGS